MSSKNLKFIVVKLQIEGLHCWPECPIDAVSYLQSPHRHTFYIKLAKEVTHNDRDIEIIMFKEKVRRYFISRYFDVETSICNFGSMSCEDIAEKLLDKFNLTSVEVLEDNENGAIITKG